MIFQFLMECFGQLLFSGRNSKWCQIYMIQFSIHSGVNRSVLVDTGRWINKNLLNISVSDFNFRKSPQQSFHNFFLECLACKTIVAENSKYKNQNTDFRKIWSVQKSNQSYHAEHNKISHAYNLDCNCILKMLTIILNSRNFYINQMKLKKNFALSKS